MEQRMPLHPSLSNAPVSRRLGESVLAVMEQLDDARRANASAAAAGKVARREARLVIVDEASPMKPADWQERPEDIARRAILESGVAEAALDEYDQQAFIDWYRLDLETDPAVFVECVIGILEALGEADVVPDCDRRRRVHMTYKGKRISESVTSTIRSRRT